MNKPILSPQKISIIVWTILGIYPLLGMGVDLITPSLPRIAQELNVSDGFSKNLITFFLLGMIAGNLIIAIVSDSVGRRTVLLSALVVFIIASLLPIAYPVRADLIICRLLQGATLAIYSTMARAILADLLTAVALMRATAMTATMWGIGPILGPIIGSYLQYYFNWHACFYFYALYALIGFCILSILLPETHVNRQTLSLQQQIKNYSEIMSEKKFIALIVLMGLSYSLLIAFNVIGPFLIQVELGYSPIAFGKLALTCGLVFLLSTLLCRYLLQIYNPKLLILRTLLLGFIAVLGSFSAFYLDGLNILIVVIPSYLMFIICGMVYPASMTAALGLFRHIAASAAVFMSLINILITCLSSLIISFLSVHGALPLLLVYATFILTSLLIYSVFLRNP